MPNKAHYARFKGLFNSYLSHAQERSRSIRIYLNDILITLLSPNKRPSHTLYNNKPLFSDMAND